MKIIRLLAVMLILISGNSFAQKPALVKPIKIPALQTFLATYKDSTAISAQVAASIVGLPIKVTDAKKQAYKIIHYQVSFKKFGVREDEETGMMIPSYTMSAESFTQTPMSAIWIKSIQELIKKGDELYFFDIIVKDAQGHVMYAPDIKFTIL